MVDNDVRRRWFPAIHYNRIHPNLAFKDKENKKSLIRVHRVYRVGCRLFVSSDSASFNNCRLPFREPFSGLWHHNCWQRVLALTTLSFSITGALEWDRILVDGSWRKKSMFCRCQWTKGVIIRVLKYWFSFLNCRIKLNDLINCKYKKPKMPLFDLINYLIFTNLWSVHTCTQ